jgi:hypothetical protein
MKYDVNDWTVEEVVKEIMERAASGMTGSSTGTGQPTGRPTALRSLKLAPDPLGWDHPVARGFSMPEPTVRSPGAGYK